MFTLYESIYKAKSNAIFLLEIFNFRVLKIAQAITDPPPQKKRKKEEAKSKKQNSEDFAFFCKTPIFSKF